MISDVLFEAVEAIDSYLNCPTFADVYKGELRDRIIKLRNEMETVCTELDTPPDDSLNPSLIK